MNSNGPVTASGQTHTPGERERKKTFYKRNQRRIARKKKKSQLGLTASFRHAAVLQMSSKVPFKFSRGRAKLFGTHQEVKPKLTLHNLELPFTLFDLFLPLGCENECGVKTGATS